MIYTNITTKLITGRNNNRVPVPRFDFEGQSTVSITWIDSNNQIQDPPSGSLYITASLQTFKKAQSSLLFYSNDYVVNADKSITFTLDTYTQTYMDQVKSQTVARLQVGRFDEDRKVFLRDNCILMPRVYIDGLEPSVVVDYYTADEVDALLSGISVSGISRITNTDGNLTLTKSGDSYNVDFSASFTGSNATKAWVQGKGYITGYTQTDPVYNADKPSLATKEWVGQQGYLTTQSDPVYASEKNTLALKTDLNSYLPLTGGVMSGNIMFTTDFAIRAGVNNASLLLYGGRGYNSGAFLELYGQDSTSLQRGGFKLVAASGNVQKIMSAYPDGRLLWDAKKIATQNWVQEQSYLTTQTDPVYTAEKDTLATKTWVGQQGYITTQTDPVYTADKPSLATKAWVQEQSYLTTESDPVYTAQKDTLATKTWIGQQGYITTQTDPVYTADKPSIATKAWVQGQSYLTTESDPVYTAQKDTLALKTQIPTKVSDLDNDLGFITAQTDPVYTADKPSLATKSWVQDQSYLTTQTDPVYESEKSSLATKTWVGQQGYLKDNSQYLSIGNTTLASYSPWAGYDTGTSLGSITMDITSGYIAHVQITSSISTLYMPYTVIITDIRSYTGTQVYTMELWITNSGSTDITTISFTGSNLTPVNADDMPDTLQAGCTYVFTVRIYGYTKLINFAYAIQQEE